MTRARFPALAVPVLAAALAACAGASARSPAADGPLPELPPGVEMSPTPPAPAAEAPAAPHVSPPKSEWPKNYETVHMKVTGMTCPIRCVREVTEQLMAVPGVLHVQIDHDEREAIVDVAPGTDPETLLRGLHAPYAGRLM